MKISVLIENTAVGELAGEHGLSMFIEYRGKYYLLDAGSSGIFVENAKKMQLPLHQTECAILSHGHYDHAGGFAELLGQNRALTVYAMRSSFDKYYSLSGGLHEIGIPEEVMTYSDSFRLIDTEMQLAEGVFLIPHTSSGLEQIGERAGLLRKDGEELLPDNFSHELSLVFDTEKGMVILNSCSHAGIGHILREVKEVFPEKRLYAFLGGLHMKGKKDGQELCTFSEAEVKQMADTVKQAGLEHLYTGHCTGEVGYQLLKQYLGEKLKRLCTGLEIQV